MRQTTAWKRGSGKTTRLVEAARRLKRPVAVVAGSRHFADELAARIGNDSLGFGYDTDLVDAYESGLPVFMDNSVFDGIGESESQPKTDWRYIPDWP